MKLHFLKMQLFISLLLVMAEGCSKLQAQILSDVDAEPKPFLIQTQIVSGLQAKGGVKKMISLVKMDVERNLIGDTSFIFYYDRAGSKTGELRYEKNKPSLFTYFKQDNQHLLEWGYNENPAQHTSKFSQPNTYDSKGNKILSAGFTISKKDTLSRTLQLFTYDIKDRLVKKELRSNNMPPVVDTYTYRQDKLTEHFHFIKKPFEKPYVQTIYSYNAAGQLVERIDVDIRDTVRIPFYRHHYSYEAERLTGEVYTSGLTGKNETVVQYHYSNDEKRLTFEATTDTFYKRVSYEYENGRIKKVHVNTNAWNSLHREFYIPLSSIIGSYTPMPIEYDEQYGYDVKGNLIEKLLLLNGKPVRQLSYEIEYY